MISSSKKKDLTILAMLFVGLLLAVSLYLFINYTEQNISLQTQSNETIGVAYEVKGDVLYRDTQSLDWFNVETDKPIYSKQFLFTNNGARAEYVFVDDSTVVQSAETLLFINAKFDLLGTLYEKQVGKDSKEAPAPTSLEMELVEGEVLVSMSKNGKLRSIKTNLGTISPETEKFSEVIVINKKNELSVDVIKGQVSLSDSTSVKSLNERESLKKTSGGKEQLGSISDKKMDKYRSYQAQASKKSQGKVKERKGFEDFLKEIVGIFLPFIN